MSFIYNIIAFLFAVCILVLMHEYGHYLVARLFKVKVLRFSIGFGKPFYIRRSKKSKTEFCIAPLLLGGYVKFLDSREMEVAVKELPLAFDHKPILARAAIILAGPLTNIVFALCAFWLMLVIGIQVPKPIIGKVIPQSIAATAGLQPNAEIIAIDQHATSSWKDVMIDMLARVGDKGSIKVTTQFSPLTTVSQHELDLTKWKINPLVPDPLADFGLIVYHPVAPTVINSVAKDSPAAHAGLLAQDKVLTINHVVLHDWDELIKYIQARPQQTLQLRILRNNHEQTVAMTTDWKFAPGWKKVGYAGIKSMSMVWPESALRLRKFPMTKAFVPTINEMWSLIRLNGIAVSKIATGKLSLRILGGPLSIYQASTKALAQGAVVYLGFLALISLALALLNLLPLPGLDGGYFIFLLIEAIFRRPVSLNVQLLILRLGMIALLVIFLQATINDVLRMF